MGQQPDECAQYPAILFDLDGTLIDSNYHHVEAWSEALRSAGIVPLWKIHRRIGMSGKSFLKELLRELAHKKRSLNLDKLEQKHDILFQHLMTRLSPVPRANELLKNLARQQVRIAIASTAWRAATH